MPRKRRPRGTRNGNGRVMHGLAGAAFEAVTDKVYEEMWKLLDDPELRIELRKIAARMHKRITEILQELETK